MSPPPLRVLHAPLNIGGQASALCRAERALGLDSHLLLLRPDPRSPEVAGTVLPEGVAAGAFPTFTGWRQRRRVLDWVLAEIDVVHFNFGRSILDYPYMPGFELRDLEELKSAGKRIIFTFQGCDARDKWDHLSQTGHSACVSCKVPWCGVKSLLRRRRLESVQRVADHIFVLNPDLALRLPQAAFLPYAVPEPEGFRTREPEQGDRPLTIVHAPTDRAIKGTRYLIETVEQLQTAGLKIRLDLVEGVTRREVFARLAAADVSVDQLLIGWYGGFAVESMWLGLPTVARIDRRVAERLIDPEFLAGLPLIVAEPEDLGEVLARLARDPAGRARASERGRAFAQHWHDPARVAARVVEHYRA